MPYMTNLPVLLFLVPFGAALFVAAIGIFIPRISWWITLAATGVLSWLSLLGALEVFESGPLRLTLAGWAAPYGIEMVLDRLSCLVAVLVSGVSFAVLVGSRSSVKESVAPFYACTMLLLAGLMGMVVAGDLFNMFVHLEVASLSAYALVAAGGRGAPRAAFNYLIIGSLGASLYLLGVGFIYVATGTLNMADAARIISSGAVESRLILTAAVLIVIGFGVKMGLFPLHGWMADAYSKAAPMSAAIMGPLVTKVAAYALVRVLFFVFGSGFLFDRSLLLELVSWAGAFAVVFGGVMAFVQTDFWRLLAFSSVSQMGLVAIGVGLANEVSMAGALLHIANDAVMKGALFLTAVLLLKQYGVRDLEEFGRIRGRAPVLALVIVVSGLSLVGIPPLCGFFGKWYVLSGALEEGAWGMVAAIVLGGLATVGYVFRMMENLFFANLPAEHLMSRRPGGHLMSLGCIALTVAIVMLGLYSRHVVDILLIPAMQQLPELVGG